MKGFRTDPKLFRIFLYLKRRRRRSNVLFHFMNVMILEYSLSKRQIWQKLRRKEFWNENILNYWTDEEWLANLRMDKHTIMYICEEIEGTIYKADTNFRKAVSVTMRCTIALYFYSSACDYRTLSNLFGIGRSTICNIVVSVSKALVNVILPKMIRLPTDKEVGLIMRGFEDLSCFTQVLEAIDSSHIRIKAPIKDAEDYINRKECHSIVLQGLVDNNYLFRDIFIGWPGKSHDARIFKNSNLYQECIKRSFLP